MKEILNKLHLSIREFAELYEIPYQTVRQWTVGERRMPEYLKKLIEKNIECRSKGKQIKIENPIYYYCHSEDKRGIIHVLKTNKLEDVKKWIKNVKSKEKWINVHEIIETYKIKDFQKLIDK